MDLLHIIGGPLVGGVIGYITNYIAIRMLFRPVKPIYIGKFRLPFTPGIVPRRKDELAVILGKAVTEKFFNSEDLAAVFSAPAFRDGVSGALADALLNGGALSGLTDGMPEQGARIRENILSELSFRVRDALLRADLPKLAALKGGQFIRNSLEGVPGTRFLTDDIIAQLAAPVGLQLERYIASDGKQIIRELVEKEVDALGERPLGVLMGDLQIDRAMLCGIFSRLYDDFIQAHVREVVATVDISSQIEGKVREMSPLALEGLVLTVVKRELNGVVWIGALLGVLIGILNIFL